MRFRPEQHLRRQSDIRTVREEGRRVDCRAFTLLWRTRRAAGSDVTPINPASSPATTPVPDALALARVCVVASSAAVGGAVQRNRAKRRLREIFRHHQQAVPAGCDLMLISRAAATRWPLADLAKKFTEACGQIKPASLPETK